MTLRQVLAHNRKLNIQLPTKNICASPRHLLLQPFWRSTSMDTIGFLRKDRWTETWRYYVPLKSIAGTRYVCIELPAIDLETFEITPTTSV